MAKPQIRFKGFDEEWEQKPLGELGRFKSNGVDKTSNANEFPVNLLNYMDIYNKRKITAQNCNNLMQVTAKLSQIIDNNVLANDIFFTPTSETANDIGRVLVIEETLPNTVYSYHLMRFRPNSNVFYPSFPNFGFATDFTRQQMVLSAQGVQRLVINIAGFENLEVCFPDFKEQQAIATFLTNIDTLIKSHKEKLEKTLDIKKAFLIKMFPTENSKTPEIRFNGFAGNWQEKELGEIFVERDERSATGEMISVTTNNGVVRAIDLDRHDNSSENKSNYKVVCEDDIAYNSMRMWQGASGRSAYSGIVSPAYTVIKPNEDINSLFFSYLFKKPEVILKFKANSQGLTSDTWNLKFPQFSKIKVWLPDFPEQKAIGEFFSNLDETISLYQKETTILENIKATLLSKMFAKV